MYFVRWFLAGKRNRLFLDGKIFMGR